MNSIYTSLLSLLLLISASVDPTSRKATTWTAIEKVFKEAPDTIQTSIYWYWISDNISKQGVINDLHAMKKAGINRAFIGNIGLDDLPDGSYGKVKIFSDEWWEILHTTLRTATELGIDIGIFNSPGWSQSGGPWVKPTQAMRYLSARDTVVHGPLKFRSKLPQPTGDFQRVNVLAFKAPKDHGVLFPVTETHMAGQSNNQNLAYLIDGKVETEVRITPNTKSIITLSANEPFTARSLTIHPGKRNMSFDVDLQVEDNNGFRSVSKFRLDRSNNNLNVGFEQFAPAVLSFIPTKGKVFRLVLDQTHGDVGISEIELSAAPRIERYKEKTLARMHPSPLPYWHDYQWAPQVELEDPQYVVSPQNVQELTKMVAPDGTLTWDIPAGKWIIMQTGMVPTGVTNAPASPEGRGLEVDKMNQEHVVQHFDAFLGEILRRIPAADRKSFKVAVQDSYETGGQNWTDGFVQKFKASLGYDPTPYLPTFYGYVVGNQSQSDRFLWDVRRFVADKVAYEYVGGLRKVSHKHGLTIWLENYGHWGFPGEFLQYGGQSDEIGGEFWSEGDLGDIENRAASSAAHIYGKTKVSAESFTAAGNTFGRYPAMFKQRGDRFFAEGINNTLLHVYIHQPYEDKLPGMNAWFGNEFNRFNTWYEDMDGFIKYIKRSNYMLQQGRYVADVAYFIGEDTPKMTGVQNPSIPKGYSFDYMNAEVILNRMTVKEGRFVLPDGLSYKILVLPQLNTMRPEVLRKIEKMVAAGGVIMGPRPQRSPSLANHVQADQEVSALSAKLWNKIDGKNTRENTYGKGLVLEGMSLEEALTRVALAPDLILDQQDPVVFIHRTLPDGDLYFLSNQNNQKIKITPSFRIEDKKPELWNAVTGEIRDLPEYTIKDGRTTMPLQLDSYESAFIIFRNAAQRKSQPQAKNYSEPKNVIPVQGTWQVTFTRPNKTSFARTFDNLVDWAHHPDTAVNYFAGSATYTKQLPKFNKEKQRVYINLGHLIALAKVQINGKDVGNVWTPPYKLNITDYCTSENNTLTVKVSNTWVNRLIGDKRLLAGQGSSWTMINPYNADSPLHVAGLLGPVQIELYE